MLSLTIFDAVRSATAKPTRALTTAARSPATAPAQVANDTAQEKSMRSASRA